MPKRITLNLNSLRDYELFLRVKSLPQYDFIGRDAIVPDEYVDRIFENGKAKQASKYDSPLWMWDYQRDITAMAIMKRKFCVFADCGLGKTAILLEFARHAASDVGDRLVLIVSPLMVVEQTLAECARFYGDSFPVKYIRANQLSSWLNNRGGGIGITNYDALTDDLPLGNLGGLILDESSMLKSHYGKWASACLRLGSGIEWKLCCTGTPAPNDRIEYANHAVFMDAFPTVNSFLARFFINRGQTQERWALKPHAIEPFYRALSHWCIFLTNPSTYGWKDSTSNVPPIHVHIDHVDMTQEQRDLVMDKAQALFAVRAGGITLRAGFGQIAKGNHHGKRVDTLKPAFIRRLVDSWPNESTIIWCIYNAEQERLEELFPDSVSIKGETPIGERLAMIEEFKSGKVRILISKPKILGFGLNLQRATRQIFSGIQDSYESFYQAVKRSNRYGSTRPLNVHIPVTEIEVPMIETVLAKAKRIQQDTDEQERIFKHASKL